MLKMLNRMRCKKLKPVQFCESRQSFVKEFVNASQLSPTALLYKMANISAWAIKFQTLYLLVDNCDFGEKCGP